MLSEIKCPYNIKIETIGDSVKDCQCLAENNGLFSLSKSHKYYSQLYLRWVYSNCNALLLFCCLCNQIFIAQWKITNNEEFKQNVKSNLTFFNKSYVCPAVLEYKPFTCYASCEKALIEWKK